MQRFICEDLIFNITPDKVQSLTFKSVWLTVCLSPGLTSFTLRASILLYRLSICMWCVVLSSILRRHIAPSVSLHKHIWLDTWYKSNILLNWLACVDHLSTSLLNQCARYIKLQVTIATGHLLHAKLKDKAGKYSIDQRPTMDCWFRPDVA